MTPHEYSARRVRVSGTLCETKRKFPDAGRFSPEADGGGGPGMAVKDIFVIPVQRDEVLYQQPEVVAQTAFLVDPVYVYGDSHRRGDTAARCPP